MQRALGSVLIYSKGKQFVCKVCHIPLNILGNVFFTTAATLLAREDYTIIAMLYASKIREKKQNKMGSTINHS